jgi:hypothetical protein
MMILSVVRATAREISASEKVEQVLASHEVAIAMLAAEKKSDFQVTKLLAALKPKGKKAAKK